MKQDSVSAHGQTTKHSLSSRNTRAAFSKSFACCSVFGVPFGQIAPFYCFTIVFVESDKKISSNCVAIENAETAITRDARKKKACDD